VKRSGPLRRRTQLRRTTWLRAKPKGGLDDQERAAAAAWRALVARGCEVCRRRGRVCPGGRLQVHHVIYAKHLAKRGLKHLRWDPRNALVCCEDSHRRHHNRREPIERRVLRVENMIFATENGLDDLLDRFYGR
jgi:5-methylcytosine-specific restriction endonuclease McrA